MIVYKPTLCMHVSYFYSADFTCTQYTNDDNDHSLQAGSSIIVTSNTLQRITCVTKNTEIISFNYNFDPPDAVVKRSEDYSPKHGVNFYLNRSAVLTIRSLNETSHNDGTYSLTVNIITVQGIYKRISDTEN